MGAPITIKRTKVTVKSKTVKPSVPLEASENEETVESAAGDVQETPEDAPVFVSKPVPTGGKSGGGSSKAMSIAAVIALIATLLFLFVLLIQWTEYRELQFLFPRPLPLGFLMAILPW